MLVTVEYIDVNPQINCVNANILISAQKKRSKMSKNKFDVANIDVSVTIEN